MSRGRKVNIEANMEAKAALLDAAALLLKSKPYKDVSLREIAQMAKQNVAMVAYYFGSKEKLFITLILRNLNEAETQQNDIEANSKQFNTPSLRIKNILKRYIELHKNNPWIARFIVDNVLVTESKIRTLFVDKIINKNAKTLSIAIRDLRPVFTAPSNIPPVNEEFMRISIISLVAFPFVANPLLSDAFDFDVRNINLDEWVEHNYQLIIARYVTLNTVSESRI